MIDHRAGRESDMHLPREGEALARKTGWHGWKERRPLSNTVFEEELISPIRFD